MNFPIFVHKNRIRRKKKKKKYVEGLIVYWRLTVIFSCDLKFFSILRYCDDLNDAVVVVVEFKRNKADIVCFVYIAAFRCSKRRMKESKFNNNNNCRYGHSNEQMHNDLEKSTTIKPIAVNIYQLGKQISSSQNRGGKNNLEIGQFVCRFRSNDVVMMGKK